MFASRDHRRRGASSVDVAFTDREGGVSDGPYSSLDLGERGEGDRQDLPVNWSRLAAAIDVGSLVTMRQLHGSDVVRVVAPPPSSPPACDALVTTTVGLALCVRAADCVPVVMADVAARVVAVAHAGRRGIAAGVLPATAAAMRELGATDIEAWIGPHICGGCYEVPEAMRREVAAVAPAAYSCTTQGTPSLDLGAAATAQLVASGCLPVLHPAPCTREDDSFFSYRRQGPKSGRLAGIVVLRDARGTAVLP